MVAASNWQNAHLPGVECHGRCMHRRSSITAYGVIFGHVERDGRRITVAPPFDSRRGIGVAKGIDTGHAFGKSYEALDGLKMFRGGHHGFNGTLITLEIVKRLGGGYYVAHRVRGTRGAHRLDVIQFEERGLIGLVFDLQWPTCVVADIMPGMALLRHVLDEQIIGEWMNRLTSSSKALHCGVKTALDAEVSTGTVALALTLAWLAHAGLATVALLIVGELVKVIDCIALSTRALALLCIELTKLYIFFLWTGNRSLLC